MLIVTEIVTMKIVAGMKKEEFIAIVDGLEKDFHFKQPGFINTELLHDDENDQWIMIQHWDSAEQLKTASRKIFQADEAASFVKAVVPKTVKMKVLPQVKWWE